MSCPRCVSLGLLDEFHAFSSCILRSIQRARATSGHMAVAAGGVLGCGDAIFRTPPVWTLNAWFARSFWSPRWPTVVGHRGLLHSSSQRGVDTDTANPLGSCQKQQQQPRHGKPSGRRERKLTSHHTLPFGVGVCLGVGRWIHPEGGPSQGCLVKPGATLA